MDHEATFEPRSVLGSRRAGWSRLRIVLPALALAATVWAGASGGRSDEKTTDEPGVVAVAAPSYDANAPRPSIAPAQAAPYPAEVVGLEVQRLDSVQARRLDRDAPVAVAGWYVATAITDCPRLAAIFRPARLPEVRGDTDTWAFCKRSGVLYASRPDLDERMPTNNLEDNRSKEAGLPAVAVTLVIGVVVPQELENIGATATQVVVVGHFVESGSGCSAHAACSRELVVDHLAWAADR